MSEPTTPHPLAIEAANEFTAGGIYSVRQHRELASIIHTTALQPVIETVERYLVAKYRLVSPYDMEARVKLADEQEKAEAELWSLVEHLNPSPKINS